MLPSRTYSVTWTVNIDVPGDHQAAAKAVADRYFLPHIAAGEPDCACCFVVAGADNLPVNIDLADTHSDMEYAHA